MVPLENLLLYIPLAALLVMLPGPDFALITRISLTEGRSSGQAAACGVALGIMVHTSAAMLGISAVIAQSATLFTLLSPYAGRNLVFGAHTASFGSAARLLGMLATTQQRWDEAQQQFENAIEFDQRSGARPWLAHSRHAYASMLLRRGSETDRAHALTLLEAALAEARQLGMARLEQMVLSTQAQASATAPLPSVAGLSPREVQVLRLMAAGKTNQEIATTLFRSPYTVANHVRNILGKTQAGNRTEASAFALHHGLLPPE